MACDLHQCEWSYPWISLFWDSCFSSFRTLLKKTDPKYSEVINSAESEIQGSDSCISCRTTGELWASTLCDQRVSANKDSIGCCNINIQQTAEPWAHCRLRQTESIPPLYSQVYRQVKSVSYGWVPREQAFRFWHVGKNACTDLRYLCISVQSLKAKWRSVDI